MSSGCMYPSVSRFIIFSLGWWALSCPVTREYLHNRSQCLTIATELPLLAYLIARAAARLLPQTPTTPPNRHPHPHKQWSHEYKR